MIKGLVILNLILGVLALVVHLLATDRAIWAIVVMVIFLNVFIVTLTSLPPVN